jgi:soluble lytic murein transglycosylase-like protein
MRQLLPVLVVLVLAAPASAHVVAPGETLSGIAAASGLPTATLAAANGIAPDAFVMAGTTLAVPAPGTIPLAPARPVQVARIAAAAAATPPASPEAGYRVRVGDTLSAVAARHGLGLAQLAAANGLSIDGVLLAGTLLRLSGVAAAPLAPAPAAAPGAAAPVATAGRLDATQISSIAGQHGVPGSLAAAIAWQESGFNNAMVSVAGARGVMQVLPSTWTWIQGSLARTPLNPASAADNVRAGSLFLADLLRQTGGDQALAAAAYYQGLGSVQRVGLLPETRKYVANVQALQARFGG